MKTMFPATQVFMVTGFRTLMNLRHAPNHDRHTLFSAVVARRLEQWLTSDRAAALIDGYMMKGEALFVFNADHAG